MVRKTLMSLAGLVFCSSVLAMPKEINISYVKDALI